MFELFELIPIVGRPDGVGNGWLKRKSTWILATVGKFNAPSCLLCSSFLMNLLEYFLKKKEEKKKEKRNILSTLGRYLVLSTCYMSSSKSLLKVCPVVSL